MGQFASYLLRTENVLIMVAAWSLISLAQRLFEQQLCDNEIWVRLLPLAPVVLCSVAVWFPGLVDGGAAEKVLLGLVLGSVSGHAYKLATQTVFGNDKRIRDHPKRL